jgi:hypothetical protein
MLLRGETAVCSERQPKHIKILLEQNSEFSILQHVLYTETVVCLKVKSTVILDNGRVDNGRQVQ